MDDRFKTLENYYDSYIKRQIKIGINKRHKAIFRALKIHILKKNQSVLEIGSGIGTLSSLIAKYLRKGSLTCVDLSPKSIEVARNRLKRFNNINFIEGNILETDFDKKYDVIVLPDVLEHIPVDLHKQLFQKMSKLLKYNGFIFINIPDPLYQDWLRNNHPYELQLIDQALYQQHIISLANMTGFYITQLECYSLWTLPVEYQQIVLRKIDFIKSFERFPQKSNILKRSLAKIKLVLNV